MFAEDNCYYSVLTPQSSNTNRSPWHIDKKIAAIIIVFIFPLILFLFCYIYLFGYEPLIYPRIQVTVNMERNYHHALLYNTKLPNVSYEDIKLPYRGESLTSIKNPKLVCYYNLPTDDSSLQVRDIDPFLCTHINAAFADVSNSTLYLSQYQLEILQQLVKLKSTNNELKVLISVGGSGNVDGFPGMVLNHTNRKRFIKSVLSFLKMYNIDGVDLDWEFPNEHHHDDKRQKIHFTQLLQEFRRAIDRQSNYNFLLTVAVAAPYFLVQNSYDVSYMNQYVDFVNLMSYDYHFYTESTPMTGLNSPLYASTNEAYYLETLNINFSSCFWNSLGMDRKKINVGLPTYGHTFRLVNFNNNGTYAPALGYGKLGTQGFATFTEICSFLSSNQITPTFDVEARSPYASKLLEWISFENTESLTYKADFILNNGFGGAMVYSLNCDDYSNICKMGEKFPLIKSIRKVLIK